MVIERGGVDERGCGGLALVALPGPIRPKNLLLKAAFRVDLNTYTNLQELLLLASYLL
jgi:hypothetical protein